MQVCLAAYTDKGKTRKVNQDAFLLQQAEIKGEDCVLAAVCDGMGGLQKGELASSEMIRSLADWFRNRLPDYIGAVDWERQILLSLEEQIRKENKRLEQYGVEQCCYGHLHGPVIRRRIEGKYGKTEFSLISGDYLGFVPKKICEM